MNEVTKGRPIKVDPIKVAAWRQARKASIAATAKRFAISPATVKRYCRDHGAEAEIARADWRLQNEIADAERLEYASGMLSTTIRWMEEAQEEFQADPSWENFFIAVAAASRIVPREYQNKKPRP